MAEPEIAPDGRKTYRVGPWVITLPGCGYAELVDVYSWAKAATSSQDQAKLAELEAEHAQLSQLLQVTPTKLMANRCLADITRCEQELSRYRSGLTGPGGRLSELSAELMIVRLQFNRARKVLAGSDLRRRVKAIHEVIERLEVTHRLQPRSKASPVVLVTRLESVRIIPRVAYSERSMLERASCAPVRCR